MGGVVRGVKIEGVVGGDGGEKIEGTGGGNVALYSRGICSKKCCRVFDAKRKSLHHQSVKARHHIYPD